MNLEFDYHNMKKILFPLFLTLSMALSVSAADQQLELAVPFTDNMILQRESEVPIWGFDAPGNQVTVEFAGQTKTTVAFLKEAKGPIASAPTEDIPPHHAIPLPGLHAYAQKSIAAGEEIELRVSSAVPYDLSVVQLGPDPENRDKDPVLKTFRVEQPQVQAIHPGSYLHVAKALPVERRMSQLTLECWIRPFQLSGWQGLVTQHDYPERCGVGLFLSEGTIVFGTGAGGAYDKAAFHQTQPGLIKAQQWHHLVANWDGKKKRIYVDGKLAAEFPFAGTVRPGETALRIGAYGQKGEAVNFYNGDIAMCAVYDRALDGEQIKKRFSDRGLNVPKDDHLLACWPFTEERGTQVADADGVDVWRRTAEAGAFDTVVCTVDQVKKDVEVKILLGCMAQEKRQIMDFHTGGMLVECPV